MRILHTADWHLGDRLGRIDRTNDLRRAVERTAALCRSERVDVLLVAGDLFSEMSRPDGLRESIQHWQEVFGSFLADGGTILAITGNHDNETFCRTLTNAMNLAAPLPGNPRTAARPGRLYLAAEPQLLRLPCRRSGFDVQFVLMPYPTPARYLRDAARQRYTSIEARNLVLQRAYLEQLSALRTSIGYDPQLPTVLAAHIQVTGLAVGSGLFRLSAQEDVLFDDQAIPDCFAYVALGHVHKPQYLGGRTHIRYSGSIERMDLGERDDQKSVVLIDLDRTGLVAEPHLIPLPATPIYDVTIRDPSEDLPRLRSEYPKPCNDLVNLHLRWTAGKDNLEEILRELDYRFPRWYAREWQEINELRAGLAPTDAQRTKGFAETVRDYVTAELLHHEESIRAAVLTRLEELLTTEDSPERP